MDVPKGGAGDGGGIVRMLAGLLDAAHTTELDSLPYLVQEHAAHAGLGPVLVYLADLQQRVLRRIPAPDADAYPAELYVDGTLAGQAFQEVRAVPEPGGGGRAGQWWVPLLDGTARLGVLRITVAEPHPSSGDAMRHLASLVALIVVSQRSHSDSFARLVRSRPMNVAAEMQWRLIPPLTFTNPQVTVGAVMEPAYQVAGDAFDYALSGGRLHLAVFDAMGHDVSAGFTASLAMAASRNHRRQGLGLQADSEAVERVIIEQFGRGDRFVTAVMGDLDLATGVLTWVNRGHPAPVVIRGRWTTSLRCPPSHPMGMGVGIPVTLCHEQLEPGDRLLLYTDGIVEAGSRQGREFGVSRLVDFLMRFDRELPVPETLRRLVRAILAYHDDHLDDDATILLVEWHGPG